ncbi:MAG: hypothetical protein HUJ25_13035 [Crocinitomicaceae bacterium]|nr:hypothetical protein [Crocinitomicaceae bacterium]
MDHFNPNIIAELYFLTTEEGGRKTPCRSGFRPIMRIPELDTATTASPKFINQEIVSPGETVIASITLLVPEMFKNYMQTGKGFELFEGHNRIAKGNVIEVLSMEPHAE